MNTIFEVPGCERCALVEEAMMFANCKLSFKDMIIPVNIHLGSTEKNWLDTFSGNNGEYSIPDTFITKMVNVRGNEVPQVTRLTGTSSAKFNEMVLLSLFDIPDLDPEIY